MDLIEKAYEFIDAGLNPLPLKSTKAPALPKGHNFLYEDIDNIEQRFATAQKIGFACGKISSNVLLLDFDKHQGQNIHERLKQWGDCDAIRSLFDRNRLSLYVTPSGGYHIYYLMPEDEEFRNKVLARYDDGSKKPPVMIETRGTGGYACTYPSEGYKHVKGTDIFNLKRIEVWEHDFIINRCEIMTEIIAQKNQSTGNKAKDGNRSWPTKWDTSTPDGRYNAENEDAAKELLRNEGWTEAAPSPVSEVRYWIRPGKTEREGISATWGFQNGMFYVFSSNAAPFDQHTAYSPFGIHVALEYNGDWKKAKDDLRELYGMKRIEAPTISDYEDVKEPEAFPYDVLPESWQGFIHEHGEKLNYPKDFLSIGMMFTMATSVGNAIKVQVKPGWEDPLIFWFVAVGEAGTLKTHPLKAAVSPLKRIDNASYKVYRAAMDEYETLTDKEKRQQKKPKFSQTLIEDSTLEALHEAHTFNARGMGLHKDELKGFLEEMNRYRSGGDEQFWLESFNNSDYKINRITRGAQLIENIFVPILGGIQPTILRKVIEDYDGSGLIDRFLYTRAVSEFPYYNTNEIDPGYLTWWQNFIELVDKECKYNEDEYVRVCFTEENQKQYAKIYDYFTDIQKDENTPKPLINYSSKLRTYAVRFALLFCVIDLFEHGTTLKLTQDHFDRAFKTVKYFYSTALKVFAESDKSKEISRVIDKMDGKAKWEQITELHNKGFKNKEISDRVNCSAAYVSKILKEKS